MQLALEWIIQKPPVQSLSACQLMIPQVSSTSILLTQIVLACYHYIFMSSEDRTTIAVHKVYGVNFSALQLYDVTNFTLFGFTELKIHSLCVVNFGLGLN